MNPLDLIIECLEDLKNGNPNPNLLESRIQQLRDFSAQEPAEPESLADPSAIDPAPVTDHLVG